jgi:hypothetical protein
MPSHSTVPTSKSFLGAIVGFPARAGGGEALEERACETGAEDIALHTAKGAVHLVHWYKRMGYRQVAIEQWRGKTYRSLILSKPL